MIFQKGKGYDRSYGAAAADTDNWQLQNYINSPVSSLYHLELSSITHSPRQLRSPSFAPHFLSAQFSPTSPSQTLYHNNLHSIFNSAIMKPISLLLAALSLFAVSAIGAPIPPGEELGCPHKICIKPRQIDPDSVVGIPGPPCPAGDPHPPPYCPAIL